MRDVDDPGAPGGEAMVPIIPDTVIEWSISSHVI
jgi:hypothetical protein